MSTASVFARALIPALVTALAAGSVNAATLDEGFNTVLPAGWTAKNNSVPLGTSGWFQGNATVFASQSGAANSYIGANFNNTAGAGEISNWLITPTLSFNNGDTLSFWSRSITDSMYPDRLEVRFSNVGGTDVGSSDTSVGSFTNLLLSINPNLEQGGYPGEWTQYSAIISGLSGATDGAIAFRYTVNSGGPAGDNSDYIGIDSVSITAAVPEPTTWALMALGLGAIGLRRRKQLQQDR
ncbi:choice-of-anchor J domain-containing protein [Paucibacter sp. DJ1R-11]|uniref:choice-of-anchor J family PEP-CTERM protein n=1 Tax=Paucibacter sp. DJ1R-11 TaxID=2893556 RepID=UPI0021E4293F|nr:choice-of-anchor J domain-containing protein [Paucibacter sp. DJ1R-11]MCV2364958.1 choice-of-anchor J domain-containing protein [Paucibacter sp. DJ1R-11]